MADLKKAVKSIKGATKKTKIDEDKERFDAFKLKMKRDIMFTYSYHKKQM